jgi:hypothetical protein
MFKASEPNASGTFFISKITRPGRIGNTQLSTAPLPLPIRTANGFFVIETDGKTCESNFPDFFNLRRRTFLAASKFEAFNLPELVDFKITVFEQTL